MSTPGGISIQSTKLPSAGPCAARQSRAHVIAGLWARFDPAAVLEDGVVLEHGGDTHIALQRHAADARQPVAGPERALLDELREGTRELDVERRGGGGRQGLDHGSSG